MKPPGDRHERRYPVTSGATLACLVTVLLASPDTLAGRDLHRLWDDRCLECHGHAGEFARRFLSEADGRLVGRHHDDDLRRFLHNHYLAGSNVDAVYDMLLAQTRTRPRFAEECSRCHGGAANFVRQSLVRDPGGLTGRASGQPLAAFLPTHNDLTPDDAAFFTRTLSRIADEVFGPADKSRDWDR